MAGFVDVTGMSDAEVKRLCQADEDDTPRRGRGMSRKIQPVMVDTATVFAAAAAAHRVNGGNYVKFTPLATDEIQVKTNRELIAEFMADTSLITDADRQLGEEVRTHFQGLTFKMLSGKMLNEFEQKALQIASSESMLDRDAAVVASLPSSYARAAKRKSAEERIADSAKEYLGLLGSKITATGEVVRCVYSTNWHTYYITLITTGGLAVFFGTKAPVDVGSNVTIEGKVKAHRPGFQTQLNYVKFI